MLENQTAFAARIGVTRQCVNGYIRDRKLSGVSLVRQGTRVLIDVEQATKQLRTSLDAEQRISNGKARLKPPTDLPKPFPTEVWEMIRGWPEQMAWTVAERGGTVEQVFDAYESACMDFGADARDTYGIDLPGSFDPVEWSDLTEAYGLVVDLNHLVADRKRFHGLID